MSRQRVEFPRLDSKSEPLIPGLPDDVATLCLLRVSADTHGSCKKVSKRWNSIFKNNRHFSTLRKEFGFQDPLLVVLAWSPEDELVRVKVLNLITLSWHTIHVTPNVYVGRGTPKSVSIPREGVLFVFGGVACYRSTVQVFLKYEARNNSWTIVKAMIGHLGLVTAGFIDGKVYVTGLDRELSDGEHGPVEVFDPKEGTWKPVLNFKEITRYGEFDYFYGATVFNGKLFLTYFDDLRTGQIFDPKTNQWENMPSQLTKGLRAGSAVEMHGHLFVLAPDDESGLRVYDAKSDSWEVVEGTALPQGNYFMAWVSSWDCKIYVVKEFLHVVVGNVTRIRDTSSCSNSKFEEKCRFRVQWEMVVDPPKSDVNLLTICAQVLIA